ncbi:polysaccharide biosynthesis tyrosine autokinase [Rhodococcus opacus]|uniref:polysaccharide biosynthesis tyrosine autokinase n=1 Tax=Rhodococcus TaxID=1827 RepID=UPI0010637F6C|nr:polysaccharide biosynthesis tyrosine autokinase [Rhodococcus opacus]MDV6241208.1 polysaccharide biosynthesis tyrosine autokinase [Rhodococcus opacus]NHU47577.1 polysaccharide biosynthesis tyrosine autokinase [Rhodococcus sp. A14]
MEIQDYLRILQSRWKIIAITTVVAILGALGASLLTTPIYEASTRLFVSTSAGSSVNEVYQGNLFSQQRVTSYTKLLTGETLAQRTIDKLDLGGTASALASQVKASSAPDTVLIDVKVQDPSPERARDIANALSDEFVVMARELETPEKGGAPAARVVVEQQAQTPSTPVSPKTLRNLALGAAVGLLLGIAFAVLRDRLDNTVKDRRTVEELAGSALIGTIPFDKERQTQQAINFAEGNSSSAESYRELRTNLQFLEVDNPPRVIVVTSSLPTEGKTTTAINIALVLAEGGQNVCLVEGDLRKPRVSKYLGVVGSVGLSSVLAGKADLDAVLQPTQYSGLTVLASGPIPPNPSELLGTETARQVLADLRGRFDYVIVDASPLLPVTDATVLTAMSDGALVIARHAETKRDQLSRAVGNLHSVGATILGTIITMTPSRGRGVYEYKYYYETDKSLPQMQQAAAVQPPVQQQPPQHQAPQQPAPQQPAPYVRDEYPPHQYGPNGGDQQEVPAYQGAPAYQGDQSQQWYGGADHYGNEQQAGAPVPPAPRRTRRYRDDQEAWSETDAPRDHTQ